MHLPLGIGHFRKFYFKLQLKRGYSGLFQFNMPEVSIQFDLTKVLEALLFSTSEPLSIKEIQAVFSRFHDQAEKLRGQLSLNDEAGILVTSGAPFPVELIGEVPALVTSSQIRDALEKTNNRLTAELSPYQIQETKHGFRLVVRPDYGFWVRLLREDAKPVRLSQAALETLAIVAYRQPVTRSEMESIRGVSVDSVLQRLIDYELVYVMGRAELPGRPVQYGTTDKFLEFTGVRALDDLPSTDVLSPEQLDEWINKANEPIHLGDADVGLPSNDEFNLENQQAHVSTEGAQEELKLDSSDNPIYEVEELFREERVETGATEEELKD